MTYIGIQTLPNVFIDNNSKETIKDITFWYEGLSSKEPKIKNLKPGERKHVAVYTRGIQGKRTLYMKHVDYSDQIQMYDIFNQLTKDYWSDILVEIKSIKEDGTLNIIVTPNFDF